MGVLKEEKAFRHYNAAGNGCRSTCIPEGKVMIDANHTFVDPSLQDKEFLSISGQVA